MQGVPGRFRSVAKPEVIDQSVSADHGSRVDEQPGQEGALTRWAEVNRTPILHNLQGPEDSEVRAHSPAEGTQRGG